MAGFFSKKQYAAIALKALAIKLLNERCLECSICAMFLSSSFTVSISARFLRSYPPRSCLYIHLGNSCGLCENKHGKQCGKCEINIDF